MKGNRSYLYTYLLILDVLLEDLQLLPKLSVLLLAHELDQLPLRLELLFDGPEVPDFLLGSVLQLLEMLASVLLGLKSIERQSEDICSVSHS